MNVERTESKITIEKVRGGRAHSVIVGGVPDIDDPSKTFAFSLGELKVLELRGKGMTKREIAEVLGRSFHTVDSHFDNVVDRNSPYENRPRVRISTLLHAAEASGLLDPQMLETLSDIAHGEVSIEEGQDALRAYQDLTTIFSRDDDLP